MIKRKSKQIALNDVFTCPVCRRVYDPQPDEESIDFVCPGCGAEFDLERKLEWKVKLHLQQKKSSKAIENYKQLAAAKGQDLSDEDVEHTHDAITLFDNVDELDVESKVFHKYAKNPEVKKVIDQEIRRRKKNERET